ncbi:hypothetical protein DL89DRAFT_267458 [Linderina pennispora]|uniref:Ribosome maturation protein SDO1/SBDS N-terminal domain-containing protein n=1 Tax=Linderina pennispora TaxID=61395 RepID=A0A1Y1W9K7_9FUNG|nr:uncharacterized protein DL89DRAFT_267458 [Linderina pennispora]ORX70230.1 hypothetical protein DL89DRAFT_267458 [Linderina pennispora]
MVLMKFTTPERVCYDDSNTDRTFFVVARPGTTSQWRTKPSTSLDDVIQYHDVFSFRRGSGEMARVASNDDLQQAFKTTDIDTVIKSVLAAGDVKCREFELDVDTQATTAANAATAAASAATESISNYVSSIWGGWGASK